MTRRRILMSPISVLLAAAVLAIPFVAGQTVAPIKRLDGTVVSVSELDSVLNSAFAIPGVAAVSVAVVQNGRIVYDHAGGFLTAGSQVRVTPQTVFRAASLSKPVFAYVVLKQG